MCDSIYVNMVYPMKVNDMDNIPKDKDISKLRRSIIFFKIVRIINSIIPVITIFSLWSGNLLYILPFLLLSILGLYLGEKMYKRILKRVLVILFNDCDPIMYLEMLKKILPRKPMIPQISSYLFLSLGLAFAGQYEESIDQLRKVSYFSRGKKGNFEKVFYYSLLFLTYIGMSNINRAEEMLAQLDQIVTDTKRADWEKLVAGMHILLKIENSVYNGALDYRSLSFDERTDRFNMVLVKYWSGKAYQGLGDIENAQEAFEYVIENGNRLYVVSRAENYLAQMK